jgi:hypothetical protein
MATKEPPAPEAYDDREIDARGILRAALVLAASVAATMVVGSWLTDSLGSSEQAGYAQPAPIATELPTSPPEPRLQPYPPESRKAMRAREDEVLGSYGWVDADAGIVSIPVAEAIEILARRGLPTRAEAPPESTVTVPTHSSPRPPASGGRP